MYPERNSLKKLYENWQSLRNKKKKQKPLASRNTNKNKQIVNTKVVVPWLGCWIFEEPYNYLG